MIIEQAPLLSYEHIPVSPAIVAITICDTPYTGRELSERVRAGDTVARVEALRAIMSRERVNAFAEMCDTRCRLAYNRRSPWFNSIVKSPSTWGRDRLNTVISHWLVAFLLYPKRFTPPPARPTTKV